MTAEEFLTNLDEARIAEAIRLAETTTSGEIRVFVSRHPSDEPLEDAKREFQRLRMHTTPQRNAVLLYFAPLSARFAIYGDEAIHARAGEKFWEDVTRDLQVHLKALQFTEAVLEGVRRAGQELARYFPKFGGDRDDLPNTVVRD